MQSLFRGAFIRDAFAWIVRLLDGEQFPVDFSASGPSLERLRPERLVSIDEKENRRLQSPPSGLFRSGHTMQYFAVYPRNDAVNISGPPKSIQDHGSTRRDGWDYASFNRVQVRSDVQGLQAGWCKTAQRKTFGMRMQLVDELA